MVVPDSPYYDPNQEQLYAQYNPELANKLLDEIGLKRGRDGYRTRPDGSRLEIIVEGMEWDRATTDEMELVVAAWNEVGVRTSMRTSSRELYWTRACGNEIQVSTWAESRAIDPMVDPIWVFPYDERSWMAPAFGNWYASGGKFGEEPPKYIKEMMDLYDRYKTTVDRDEQIKIAKELLRRNAEGCFVIGTVGLVPNVVVVKNDFRNVPETFTTDWIYMAPGTLDPCHFYFDR